jgi:hypothetical protein
MSKMTFSATPKGNSEKYERYLAKRKAKEGKKTPKVYLPIDVKIRTKTVSDKFYRNINEESKSILENFIPVEIVKRPDDAALLALRPKKETELDIFNFATKIHKARKQVFMVENTKWLKGNNYSQIKGIAIKRYIYRNKLQICIPTSLARYETMSVISPFRGGGSPVSIAPMCGAARVNAVHLLQLLEKNLLTESHWQLNMMIFANELKLDSIQGKTALPIGWDYINDHVDALAASYQYSSNYFSSICEFTHRTGNFLLDIYVHRMRELPKGFNTIILGIIEIPYIFDAWEQSFCVDLLKFSQRLTNFPQDDIRRVRKTEIAFILEWKMGDYYPGDEELYFDQVIYVLLDIMKLHGDELIEEWNLQILNLAPKFDDDGARTFFERQKQMFKLISLSFADNEGLDEKIQDVVNYVTRFVNKEEVQYDATALLRNFAETHLDEYKHVYDTDEEHNSKSESDSESSSPKEEDPLAFLDNINFGEDENQEESADVEDDQDADRDDTPDDDASHEYEPYDTG